MTQSPLPMAHKGFSKTAKIVVAIIVVTCVALASSAAVLLSRPLQTGNNIQNNNPQNNINPKENTIPLRVVLKVDGGVINGYWTRDVGTDLPEYESTVSYSVSDVGNRDESSVSISISIDGNPYSSNVIPLIAMSSSYSSSFLYSTPYDQTSNVLIQANCQDSSDSYTLTVGSMFPRSWNTENISPTTELFVTPKEKSVVAMKDNILRSKFFLDADWTALWSWVGSHITYETEDSANYHWQFPKETLLSKCGLCADYSALLVSLYRDGVFGPKDAYVVLGTNQNGKGHAWVIVRLPVVGWYTLDPQENSGFFVNLALNPFKVSGYTAQYEFNDQQFLTISS